MNTGDLQYVSGDLYVSGTVVAKNVPAGGGTLTAVTVAGGAPLKALTAGSTVTLSYAAESFGGPEQPPETVPVNSLLGYDNVGVGSNIVIPVVGNVAFSGGAKSIGGPNPLPSGGVWVNSVAGSAVSGFPVGTDGTVLVTNVGIGSVTAGDATPLTFTGTGARQVGSVFEKAAPGNVTFEGGSGVDVSSQFATAAGFGSGVVTISNTGVTSVGLPADTLKRSRLGAAVAAATGDIVLQGAGATTITQDGSTFTISSSATGQSGILALTDQRGASADAGTTGQIQLFGAADPSNQYGINIRAAPEFRPRPVAWATGTVYTVGTLVTYNPVGAAPGPPYAATCILQTTVGPTPNPTPDADPTHWSLIPEFSVTSVYAPGDIVTLNQLYQCVVATGPGEFSGLDAWINESYPYSYVQFENTGVTKVDAGDGIELSGQNLEVTISNSGLLSATDGVNKISGALAVSGVGPGISVYTVPTATVPKVWDSRSSYAVGDTVSYTFDPTGPAVAGPPYLARCVVTIPPIPGPPYPGYPSPQFTEEIIPPFIVYWQLVNPWVSGASYQVGYFALVGTTAYECYKAVSGSSVSPASDIVHWVSSASTLSGIVTTNTGVTSAVAGAGIGVSAASGAVTITNTGVRSASAGAGISVTPNLQTGNALIANTGIISAGTTGAGLSASTASGALTLSNTGVTSLTQGAGISVSGASGAVQVTNTGVLSFRESQAATSIIQGPIVLSTFPGAPNGATVTYQPAFFPTNGTGAWNATTRYYYGDIVGYETFIGPIGSIFSYFRCIVQTVIGGDPPTPGNAAPYFEQIPNWASGTVYAIGAYVVDTSTPTTYQVYQCFSPTTSLSTTTPAADPTHWVGTGATSSALFFGNEFVIPGSATTAASGNGGFLGYLPPGTDVAQPYVPQTVDNTLTVVLAPKQFSAWISVPNLQVNTSNLQPVFVAHPLATAYSTYMITPAFDASSPVFRVGDSVVSSYPTNVGGLFGVVVFCQTAAPTGESSRILFCITFFNPTAL